MMLCSLKLQHIIYFFLKSLYNFLVKYTNILYERRILYKEWCESIYFEKSLEHLFYIAGMSKLINKDKEDVIAWNLIIHLSKQIKSLELLLTGICEKWIIRPQICILGLLFITPRILIKIGCRPRDSFSGNKRIRITDFKYDV